MDDNEEYEMVSGHRRMHAAQLAGLTTIPAIVRELSDDDAIVAMVDANIQREELLPSEKAFAYKMKLEAMKRQGVRTDLTLSQNETKLRSDEVLSKYIFHFTAFFCVLQFYKRKDSSVKLLSLTNIFNETSEPSSFCCLPIITIGVIDYRHCNQKNLKIYLSTLHKSV